MGHTCHIAGGVVTSCDQTRFRRVYTHNLYAIPGGSVPGTWYNSLYVNAMAKRDYPVGSSEFPGGYDTAPGWRGHKAEELWFVGATAYAMEVYSLVAGEFHDFFSLGGDILISGTAENPTYSSKIDVLSSGNATMIYCYDTGIRAANLGNMVVDSTCIRASIEAGTSGGTVTVPTGAIGNWVKVGNVLTTSGA